MFSPKFSAAYLLFQGFAGIAWWLMLFVEPRSRQFFRVAEAPDVTLLAFWLPDMMLFVIGSISCGLAILKNWQITRPLLWITVGATTYATLYNFALTAMTGAGLLGSVLMTPAMLITIGIAVRYACLPAEPKTDVE
jgi:hypothetical protein